MLQALFYFVMYISCIKYLVQIYYPSKLQSFPQLHILFVFAHHFQIQLRTIALSSLISIQFHLHDCLNVFLSRSQMFLFTFQSHVLNRLYSTPSQPSHLRNQLLHDLISRCTQERVPIKTCCIRKPECLSVSLSSCGRVAW